jgi:hypothetical protein
VPKPPVGHILVFGARPCSPGRRYCDKLRYLGLLPAPKRRRKQHNRAFL